MWTGFCGERQCETCCWVRSIAGVPSLQQRHMLHIFICFSPCMAPHYHCAIWSHCSQQNSMLISCLFFPYKFLPLNHPNWYANTTETSWKKYAPLWCQTIWFCTIRMPVLMQAGFSPNLFVLLISSHQVMWVSKGYRPLEFQRWSQGFIDSGTSTAPCTPV